MAEQSPAGDAKTLRRGLANAKAKGARRELAAKSDLESLGYHVNKAGGSLGTFDLIAILRDDRRYIQVKSNRLPDPGERQAMILALEQQYPIGGPLVAPPAGLPTVEAWVYYDGLTVPRIEVLWPTSTTLQEARRGVKEDGPGQRVGRPALGQPAGGLRAACGRPAGGQEPSLQCGGDTQTDK